MSRLTDPAGSPPPGKLPAGLNRDILAKLVGALNAARDDTGAWVPFLLLAQQVGSPSPHDGLKRALGALAGRGLVRSHGTGRTQQWRALPAAREVL